jgi:hypothetical protein
METLFSHHRLQSRLQAIKLLISLTYPLKTTKHQSISSPTTHHDLLLVDIQHDIGLSGVYRCEGHLKLQHLKLLLNGGDHYNPLVELEILLLIGALKVHDRVGALIYHFMSGIKVLTSVVPLTLNLTEETVRYL